MILRTLCFATAIVFFMPPTGLTQEKEEKTPAKEMSEEAQAEKKDEGHRFPVKAMDRFHDILHPLVHDALPDGDLDAIRSQLDSLVKEANAIQNASLPEKYEARQEKFKALAEVLVNQLAYLKETSDDDELAMRFEEMHETFEQMVRSLR